MKTKKGQIVSLQIIVIVLVFLIIWAFLAGIISSKGSEIAVETGVTGVEAFILLNLNTSIFFMLLLFILAAGYYGGFLT